MNKKIIKVNKTFTWGFRKKKHKFDAYNDQKYVDWVVSILQKAEKELGYLETPKNAKLNACCLSAHPSMNEYLHKYLDPMTWLSYSPKDDETLKKNQIAIDLENIFEWEGENNENEY